MLFLPSFLNLQNETIDCCLWPLGRRITDADLCSGIIAATAAIYLREPWIGTLGTNVSCCQNIVKKPVLSLPVFQIKSYSWYQVGVSVFLIQKSPRIVMSFYFWLQVANVFLRWKLSSLAQTLPSPLGEGEEEIVEVRGKTRFRQSVSSLACYLTLLRVTETSPNATQQHEVFSSINSHQTSPSQAELSFSHEQRAVWCASLPKAGSRICRTRKFVRGWFAAKSARQKLHSPPI